MLPFTVGRSLVFRQQSKLGPSMPLGNGETKYGISWEGKQNHELWKQYFRAVNTKLDKLWKINRIGALKSQIIFNAFIVP